MTPEKTRKILAKIGKPRQIGEALGISRQAVEQWKLVPPEQAIPLAKFTKWVVTPHQLRPDLYPHKEDGLPPRMRCK